MTAAAIDWGQLFELVWVSAVAGFGVSLTFSLIILGITKAAESRQADRTVAATAYATMAVLGFAVFAGGVIFGISVIISK